MNYYVDICVCSVKDMNQKYTELHKALYEMHSNKIGVSFPLLGDTMGRILRVHGNMESLVKLRNYYPYYLLMDISKTPKEVQHCIYKRRQPTMSQSKIRRLIKRGNMPVDKIAEYNKKMNERKTRLPYLEIRSASSGQLYRRFIKKIISEKNEEGNFDCFGFSETRTVPFW